MIQSIPIIIPAYEPDARMIDLLNNIKESGSGTVIIVDDGSDVYYDIYRIGPHHFSDL